MAKATVGLDIDINSNSVATATRRSDALARSTDKLTRGLRGLGTGIAVAGAAITAAAGGLLVMTKRIADQADEIAKHSTRIGVTIESYQELSHAMELSGGNIGEASAALRRLSGNMLDASQGVSTAVDAFDGIGVSALTATGGLRSVDDVLADIADEFAQMEDGSLKTARAMELFGRSGATLIPLLNQGAEGIAEMRREAHELGIVISTETAHAAEALNDDLTRLKGIATGFANQLATHLIPRMRDVVANLTDFAMRAGQSNANFGRLAREGLDAMISALVVVAQAGIRVTQGILGLRQAWLEMKDSAIDYLNIFRARNIDDSLIQGQIESIQETVGNLEVMHGAIGALDDERGPRQLSESFGELSGMVERARRHADNFALDPDPGPTREAAEALDKYSLAAKNASRSVAELHTHNEQVAAGMTRLFSEFRAAQAELAESKALEESIQAKDAAILDYEKRLLELSETVDKSAEDMSGKFGQLASIGKSAFSGLTSAISQLSLAAFFRKDGNALKEFGKSLGQMLVQLGTMAVVYAGVAALGNVFPALQPLVGPAAAAPALAAAGAVAIAAGAGLGAATGGGGRSGPSRGRADDGAGSARETSQTTIYNVTLGAGMSRRGQSRALLEQVSSAVEAGV